MHTRVNTCPSALRLVYTNAHITEIDHNNHGDVVNKHVSIPQFTYLAVLITSIKLLRDCLLRNMCMEARRIRSVLE